MNSDWADRMSRRLRAATPTMAPARPVVDDAVRQAAQATVGRGRTSRVVVRSSDQQISVTGSGPAMAAARAEIDRRRPQIGAAVRADASRRMHG